jgi:Na+-translocating ferredoxin:NAD+ oxidoreductase RnfC subunit
VHPVYGAIYQEGEFVQRGAVLGLSVDSKAVVTAPVSGWVRLPTAANEMQDGLCVEIWTQPDTADVRSNLQQ